MPSSVGIALDAQPDVERLGIEGFEFGGKAFVHAEAIAFYVGRAFVDGGGEGLEEIFPKEVAAQGDDLLGAAIEEGEVIVAIEEDDRVGGGLKELLHLPEQGSFTVGARWECRHATSLREIAKDCVYVSPGARGKTPYRARR